VANTLQLKRALGLMMKNIRSDIMKVVLDDYTENPEMKIAKCGGVSHGADVSDIEEARERVQMFVDDGHWSTLEFADATFHVSGVSRSFLAQITRHRHASFMVKSQRYVDASGEDMVEPETVQDALDDSYVFDAYYDYNQATSKLISRLKEAGVPKEDYRFFLPIATTTEMYIKANLREWRHIIDLRGLNEHAQWEIRDFAQRALKKLYKVAPSVFEDQYKEV